MVGQNVGRALSGERCGSDGKHIGSTTETVGDEQDVGVTSWRDRKRIEVVDTDGDVTTFRQRHGDDWPSDSQSLVFPCLALQAVAKPPPGGYVHANPPVKPLQYTRRARGAKVARGRRITSLHDPRAHEQMHVDANRLVVQQARRSPHRARRVRRWLRRRITVE